MSEKKSRILRQYATATRQYPETVKKWWNGLDRNDRNLSKLTAEIKLINERKGVT